MQRPWMVWLVASLASGGCSESSEGGLDPSADASIPRPEDARAPASDGGSFDVSADDVAPPDTSPRDTPPSSVALTHLGTKEMPLGTHRPEIFPIATGAASLLLAVVEPSGDPKQPGGIKHQAYRLTDDLEVVGDPFVLTTTTEEYGEPADHRALVVGDELVVVYQTLLYDPDAPAPTGGPSEAYALSQSLMLARFTLTGEELFRGPIVARATDFDEDNFPDHCMVFDGESLIVSTGSASNHVNFRVVSLEGEVSETMQVSVASDTIPSTIGNSLFHQEDRLVMVSSEMMGVQGAKSLVFSELGPSLAPTPLATHTREGEDATFPTGTFVHAGVTFIAYSAHEAGSSPDIQVNPYQPRLAAFDGDFQLLADVVVSTEDGAGHVHPTVAILGDTLYYAWSHKDAGAEGPTPPQVLIERYGIAIE